MIRHHAGACLLTVTLISVCYIAIAPFFLGHFDIGWHIAAGDLIRRLGAVPVHDPWSFTTGDKQWFNLSWAWDVATSVLFQYGGFTALILETLACGAFVAAGLFAICIASGAAPLAAAIVVFFACVLYPIYAAPDLFLGVTPGVMTIASCVVFYGACLRPRFLWLTPLCMLVWVNMHGGFIVGPAMLGAFGAMALLRRDLALFARYLAFGLATLAVTFVNPVGGAVYEGVLGTVGHFALDHITEWMPFFRIVGYPGCLPLCLYALVFAALELADIRARPLEARLLSWAFLIAGIWKLRYLSLFLVFSTVPLALHLDHLLPRVFTRRIDDRHLGIAGAALLCCLPLLYWRSVPPNPGLLPQIYPRAEIDWLIAHPPHAHLLNHWNYGGFLIFRTRGSIPVFVDGRSATAYPDSLLHDYFPLMNPQVDPATWQRALAKYRIDTIMWPKAHTALQDYLTGNGWQLAYSGPIANIYVKPP